MLFRLYIQEISNYIDRGGCRGASLANTWITLLLYADDIVLIVHSPQGLQQHLDALHAYAGDRDLTVNLGKTEVTIFNTTTQRVT